MKKIYMYLLFLCFSNLLVGCTTSTGSVYGKSKVLNYVEEVCPTEEYTYLGSQKICNNPTNVEYYFETARGLAFTANSYLSPFAIDGGTSSLYTRSISCNYVDKVKQEYLGEVNSILQEGPYAYISSYEDIAALAFKLAKANEIYVKEKEYNTEEFLEENPVKNVYIRKNPIAGSIDEDQYYDYLIPIDGSMTESAIERKIADSYVQAVVDGYWADTTIPDWELKEKHISEIDTIYLNGEEMIYDTAYCEETTERLSTYHYKDCWYSYEAGSYILYCDKGILLKRESSPLIVREYVQDLGGIYELNTSKNQATWTIGEDTWKMSLKNQYWKGEKLLIEKNGETLDITYYVEDEIEGLDSDICVGMKIEDFAKLFDLEYEINEEEGILYFQKGSIDKDRRL